jgi:hypothetical protein
MELLSVTDMSFAEDVLAPVAKQSGDEEYDDELEDSDDFEGDDDEFDPDLDMDDEEFFDDEEDEDA